MRLGNLGAGLLLAGSLLRCSAATLQPAADAALVPGVEHAAQAATPNVKLVAQGGAWELPAEVDGQVTVLRITVKNAGREPLGLRYENFELESADGERFGAVLPGDVDVQLRRRSLGLDPDAPRRASADALLNSSRGSEGDETVRAELFSDLLRSTRLEPGEQASGFVYFEQVPPTKAAVVLRMQVQNARTGSVAAVVEIPFRVGD